MTYELLNGKEVLSVETQQSRYCQDDDVFIIRFTDGTVLQISSFMPDYDIDALEVEIFEEEKPDVSTKYIKIN